jgi:hypothetical protein
MAAMMATEFEAQRNPFGQPPRRSSDDEHGEMRDVYEQGAGREVAEADVETDVDVTLLAYAQWISGIKEQVAGAKHGQKLELEAVREMARDSSSQLAEFKRYCTTAVQRLENQVSDLRARLTDIVADGVLQGRHHAVTEQRQDVDRRGDHRRTAALQDTQATGEIEVLREEVGNVRNALAHSNEHTIAKFGEVDRALSVFRTSLSESKLDAKKGQDLLGQAINTLSQDLAEFQQQATGSYGSAPGRAVDDQREYGRREVIDNGSRSAPGGRLSRPPPKESVAGPDVHARPGKFATYEEEDDLDAAIGRRVSSVTFSASSDGASRSGRRGYGG